MISSDELEATAKQAKRTTPGWPVYLEPKRVLAMIEKIRDLQDLHEEKCERILQLEGDLKHSVEEIQNLRAAQPSLQYQDSVAVLKLDLQRANEYIAVLKNWSDGRCMDILYLREEIARLTRVNESHMTMWNQAEDELKRVRELLVEAEKAFEIISNMGTQSRDGHKINGPWTIAKEMLEKIKAARGEK